jgi:hypothetical protein
LIPPALFLIHTTHYKVSDKVFKECEKRFYGRRGGRRGGRRAHQNTHKTALLSQCESLLREHSVLKRSNLLRPSTYKTRAG